MAILKDYISYRIHAKSRHGIHSPFVYNLLDQYLYNRIDSGISKPIENLRKALLKDKNILNYEDLGAGSKKLKTGHTRVCDLAKTSLKDKKYAKLIAQIAQYTEARNIIELGTSLGITTLYISALNPDAKIYTIEGSPEIAKIAQKQFKQLNAKNIQSIVGNFDWQYPNLLAEIQIADFIFIDGNHTYKATREYFELALKYVHEKSVIVFDDINWSKEMKKAWLEIKQHPKVSISLDFFFLGVVFFNPSLSKEEFLIRY